MKKIEVYDEDGIFSIVNTDRYKTFVDEDWSLEQLLEHFTTEMKNRNCIVWQVSNEGGGEWILEILEKPSENKSFREFTKSIEVTNEKLHFVNYTDLTMAAQFNDISLPEKQNADWFLHLDNGLYDITVRQMFDPYDYENEEEQIFEIIPHKISEKIDAPIHQIFWWNE